MPISLNSTETSALYVSFGTFYNFLRICCCPNIKFQRREEAFAGDSASSADSWDVFCTWSSWGNRHAQSWCCDHVAAILKFVFGSIQSAFMWSYRSRRQGKILLVTAGHKGPHEAPWCWSKWVFVSILITRELRSWPSPVQFERALLIRINANPFHSGRDASEWVSDVKSRRMIGNHIVCSINLKKVVLDVLLYRKFILNNDNWIRSCFMLIKEKFKNVLNVYKHF